jgi:two-component system, cell cycle sensor histidine kinase and response regulator CckA
MAKILVVDDNEINRLLIVKLLGRYNHQLQQAIDGAAGLAAVRADPPDLVITDLLMPQTDGYELIRQLRADPQTANIPIIVYTALYMARGVSELAKVYNVTHVLTKPSKPEVILKTVNEALSLPTQSLNRQELASLRLRTCLEILQQLGPERDPAQLFGNFCERLRKLISAQFTFLGVPERTGPEFQYFLASGIEVGQARKQLLPRIQQVLDRVSAERIPLSLSGADINPSQPASTGEEVHSVLAAPLSTTQQGYGWVCLVDRLGANEFTEEDAQLLAALASSLALAYENILLNAHLRQKS